MKKLYTLLAALLLITSCAIEAPTNETPKEAYEGTWFRTITTNESYKIVISSTSYSLSNVISSSIAGISPIETVIEKGIISEINSTTLKFTKTHIISNGTLVEIQPIELRTHENITWSIDDNIILLLSDTANSYKNGSFTKQ